MQLSGSRTVDDPRASKRCIHMHSGCSSTKQADDINPTQATPGAKIGYLSINDTTPAGAALYPLDIRRVRRGGLVAEGVIRSLGYTVACDLCWSHQRPHFQGIKIRQAWPEVRR